MIHFWVLAFEGNDNGEHSPYNHVQMAQSCGSLLSFLRAPHLVHRNNALPFSPGAICVLGEFISFGRSLTLAYLCYLGGLQAV
jgi:hypothetical protein